MSSTPVSQETLTTGALLRLYLPLIFLAFVWMSGPLAINGVLLRYENGLNAFTACLLALGFIAPLQGLLVFVPQLSTVLGRGPGGRSATLRFVCALTAGIVGGIWALVVSPWGLDFLHLLYHSRQDTILQVRHYLIFLLPLLMLEAIGRWSMGQLVQRGRSLLYTNLEIGGLVAQLCVLIIGFTIGIEPLLVIVGSFCMNTLIGQGCAMIACKRLLRNESQDNDAATHVPSLAEMTSFFTPLAITSLSFAIGKTVLLVALTHAELNNQTAEIAAYGLLMSLNALFNQPLNQARHLYSAYGGQSLSLVRVFHRNVSFLWLALCTAFIMTPGVELFLAGIQGADGVTLSLSLAASPLVLALPVAAAFRCDAQGRAIVAKRTGSLAAAALTRLAIIILATIIGLQAEWLDHRGALLVLILGFIVETLTLWVLNWLREKKSRYPTPPASILTSNSLSARL